MHQMAPHKLVHLGPIHLPYQPSAVAPLTRLLVSRHGPVFAGHRVARQLATDRRAVPPQFFSDLGVRKPGVAHLGYAFSFFQSKLMGHRWDSVRPVVGNGSTSRTPSDVFTNSNSPRVALQIRRRLLKFFFGQNSFVSKRSQFL